MPASDELPSYQFTPVCQRTLPEQRANVNSNNGFTSYLQNPYYFMHASLVEKDTREDVLLIKDTRSKEDMHLFKDNRTKATTGSSVSSLYPLKDFEDNGTESGFFVFPDLSVRMEGTYRLKFCLYEMVGKDVHFCAFVISDPLVVYSAKKFPGMEESTQLSQYFAEQGLKIRIRKEVRPKKRSRGEFIAVPSSQSPTDSHHRDREDAVESQEDDDQFTAKDTPSTSKRRASGTRDNESRSKSKNPTTPPRLSLTTDDPVSRSNQPGKSTSVWRTHTPDCSESQSISNLAEKSGSMSEPYHQQQYSYFRSEVPAARRFSGSNMDETPSFVDSGSNIHPLQRADGNRIRSQESTTTHGSQPSYRPLSSTKQPASITNSEKQSLDQRSTVHQPELRRGNGSMSRRDFGAEPLFIYESRSPWIQKEYISNVQSSDDTKLPQTEAQPVSYSTRQNYPNSTSLRSDHSYVDDHHRGVSISTVFDRSDHVSRVMSDMPQRKQSFHSASEYPPHYLRNQQQSESHTFSLQDQRVIRQKSTSHHDYPGFQGTGSSYPPSVSHGKYSSEGTSNISFAPQGDHGQSANYPSVNVSSTTGQGRYPIHGHSSVGHESRDNVETPRRASTTTSPPRPAEHRPQTLSTPNGYTNFHRDRETEGPRQYSSHPLPGQSQHLDEGSHSMTPSGSGSRHLRINPSTSSYANRHVDPAPGGILNDPFSRPVSVDYHIRSIPASTASVQSHPSITGGPPRQGIHAIGFSGGPEKNRGIEHYDKHYTATVHSPFRDCEGDHGYKNPSSSSLPAGSRPYESSYINNQLAAGYSEHHQFQNHNHIYQHYSVPLTQNIPQAPPHGYGYQEQQRTTPNQFYPQ
ncbi:hypothetical protein BGZ76_009782 [Entomortierella beljakovae]|nr:hypothetical protein BGZ76_009782 [Entomortierella beljakovae]